MTPKGTPDPEYPTSSSRKGDRRDRKNLIDIWLKAKPVGLFIIHCRTLMFISPFALHNVSSFPPQKKKSHYVWHRKEFDEINVKTTDRLMGGYRYVYSLQMGKISQLEFKTLYGLCDIIQHSSMTGRPVEKPNIHNDPCQHIEKDNCEKDKLPIKVMKVIG